MANDVPRRFRDWTISLPLWLLVALSVHLGAAQTRDEVTPEVQNLYGEARAARQRGDIPTAVEKYREMIKLAPHLAAAYNNLGMLYFDTHDYKKAVEVLHRGLEL